METDSLHDTTVSVVDSDPTNSIEVQSTDNDARLEERSSTKEVMREIGSDLIRLGLDLACCSEKLVNMNLLMMHVAAKESDFEAFVVEKGDKPVTSAVAALEFDILSGYFDLEVKEMDNFIGKLQMKFKNSSNAISSHKHMDDGFLKLEEKLLDAEKSLKQSQEQVSELIAQSTKFQKLVSCANRGDTSDLDKDAGAEGNGDTTPKFQMQTSEQQLHMLRMLEKSLARELDLENQLTDCMQTLDKMKRKLYYSQRELLSVEEETAAVYAKFLEADNASAVWMGISKELIGQLQSCQLNINNALSRESELNAKLQNCMQAIEKLEKEEAISQELATKNNLEAMVLKEKVDSLEEQLKSSELAFVTGSVSVNNEIKVLEEKVVLAESRAEKVEAENKVLSVANKELSEELDLLKRSGITNEKIVSLEERLKETEFQLQQATASIEASEERETMYCTSIEDMKIVIEKLRANVLSAESRSEPAESECKSLAETNDELKKELDSVKADSVTSENVVILEKQLRDAGIQLQQATASVEASQEKQIALVAALNNTENLIEKLKSSILKANTRADSAEDKCVILSESHDELNEELNFLRRKVGCLEASLQQAEEAKLAAANDINIRTKLITDLVVQLALEREQLQKQISWLMAENRTRKEKHQKPSRNSVHRDIEETGNGVLSSEHVFSSDIGREDSNFPGSAEVHKTEEGVLNGESNSETDELKSKLEAVRTIDAGQLNFKHVLSASLIALIAVLATCFLSPENCPFGQD